MPIFFKKKFGAYKGVQIYFLMYLVSSYNWSLNPFYFQKYE
jgi:hypothetical protein